MRHSRNHGRFTCMKLFSMMPLLPQQAAPSAMLMFQLGIGLTVKRCALEAVPVSAKKKSICPHAHELHPPVPPDLKVGRVIPWEWTRLRKKSRFPLLGDSVYAPTLRSGGTGGSILSDGRSSQTTFFSQTPESLASCLQHDHVRVHHCSRKRCQEVSTRRRPVFGKSPVAKTFITEATFLGPLRVPPSPGLKVPNH